MSVSICSRNLIPLTNVAICNRAGVEKIAKSTLTRQRRPIFSLSGIGIKNRQYAKRKLVGYSMDQMFAVVSDVENYRNFVPWCQQSLVSIKKNDYLRANLIIGFPPINEQYTSEVTFKKPHLVRAECTEGRLFNHLMTLWRFSPGLRSQPQSCVIDFQVSFEFRSALYSQMANLFFDKVVLQMEDAFVREGNRRYGKPSVPTQILSNDSI